MAVNDVDAKESARCRLVLVVTELVVSRTQYTTNIKHTNFSNWIIFSLCIRIISVGICSKLQYNLWLLYFQEYSTSFSTEILSNRNISFKKISHEICKTFIESRLALDVSWYLLVVLFLWWQTIRGHPKECVHLFLVLFLYFSESHSATVVAILNHTHALVSKQMIYWFSDQSHVCANMRSTAGTRQAVERFKIRLAIRETTRVTETHRIKSFRNISEIEKIWISFRILGGSAKRKLIFGKFIIKARSRCISMWWLCHKHAVLRMEKAVKYSPTPFETLEYSGACSMMVDISSVVFFLLPVSLFYHQWLFHTCVPLSTFSVFNSTAL